MQTASQDDSVKALANAIEARDYYTRGHTDRVTSYTVKMARNLGWIDNDISHAQIGMLLHDIGKIGIPDAILNKPSKLTFEEYGMMKKHVDIGAMIIRDIPKLQGVQDYILCHHERFDGKGYPRGLVGTEIPLGGRIGAVADSFDAMTSKRVYKESRSVEESILELRKCSGSQFDPDIVDLFVEMLLSGDLNEEIDQLTLLQSSCSGTEG